MPRPLILRTSPLCVPRGTASRSGPSRVGTSNLGTERRLRKANRHLANEVVTPPFEERMLLHQDLDPEVAAAAAHIPQFPLVAALQPDPALDAGRDVNRERSCRGQSSGSSAVGEGIGDSHALAAAGRARGRHLEETTAWMIWPRPPQ